MNELFFVQTNAHPEGHHFMFVLLLQGASQPAPKGTRSRYAAVAGYFFFPLLRNYDK